MRRWLTAVLVAVCAVLTLPGVASAHNVLERAEPANRSSVSDGPQTVTLYFNDDVQQGPNRITVIGPDGKQWQRNRGEATVEGATVTNQLRPLGPKGKYTVGYRVISADGHPLEGSITFNLTTEREGTPNPDAVQAASRTDSGGGVPIWVWIGGAVVLLAVGLFVALRAGRET